MKKAFKLLLVCVLCLLLVAFIGIGYIVIFLPNVGSSETLTVQSSTERIERGKYLANSVTVCMDCHSTRDWNQFSGPLVEGTLGKGGEVFDQRYGFPGSFHARNITPSGIGDWTDGELLRAIASGVDKKGRALFPVMPHPSYGKMDKEDILSIIAYLRTLSPIENKVPDSKADFPMNIILHTIPAKAEYGQIPDSNNLVERGAYYFNAASCGDCHTKQDKGNKIKGMELAGGFEFPMKTGGIVRSSNITPDQQTGIGSWDEAAFLRRFKAYGDSSYQLPSIGSGDFNSVMPWTMYKNMKESDLKAIYAYLKTVPPIKNQVVKFSK
jgi:cytochrome c2